MVDILWKNTNKKAKQKKSESLNIQGVDVDVQAMIKYLSIVSYYGLTKTFAVA